MSGAPTDNAGPDWTDVALRTGATVFLTLGVLLGAVLLLAELFVAWFVALTAGALVVGAVALVLSRRAELRPEVLPPFPEQVDPRAVREFDGIQIFARPFPQKLRRGSVQPLEFVLQSCVSQPREVRLRIDSAGAPEGYRFERVSGGRMGPGDQATLSVPLVVGPDVRQRLQLEIHGKAEGAPARRARYRRARPLTAPLGGMWEMFALMFSFARGGDRGPEGGLVFTPGLTPEPPDDAWKDAPTAPSFRITWSPDPDALDRAMRR